MKEEDYHLHKCHGKKMLLKWKADFDSLIELI